MSLLRLTSALLFASLIAAFATPAGAEQVFSSVSTGPIHTYPTQAPYPIGDIYYSPCGWNGNYGGGGNGFGRGLRGGRLGNTTLTGERFYPYDISQDQNRINGRRGTGGHGNSSGFVYGNSFGMNCYGQGRGINPSPPPRRPIPVPYATPRT